MLSECFSSLELQNKKTKFKENRSQAMIVVNPTISIDLN